MIFFIEKTPVFIDTV